MERSVHVSWLKYKHVSFRPAKPDAVKRRKSYTIAEKLRIIEKYEFGVARKGIPYLAKSHGVACSTLRGWIQKRDEMINVDHKPERRRLGGGGKQAAFKEMEKELYEWLLDQKNEGRRVKDKKIQEQALYIHQNRMGTRAVEDCPQFVASSGWLQNFKKRYSLATRRNTSVSGIPEDAAEICREFIEKFRSSVRSKKIESRNIINCIHISRLSSPGGRSDGKVRRGLAWRDCIMGNRFTITLAISADGNLHTPHFLFGKLKMNQPESGAEQSGSVSLTFLESLLRKLAQPATSSKLRNEPTLILLEHHPLHVKLAESRLLESDNVYVMIIPRGLDSLLQPLGILVDQNFQYYLSKRIEEYIQSSEESGCNLTVSGNIKRPSCKKMFDWVTEWTQTVDSGTVRQSFRSCGLCDDFGIDFLHDELKILLEQA